MDEEQIAGVVYGAVTLLVALGLMLAFYLTGSDTSWAAIVCAFIGALAGAGAVLLLRRWRKR